MDSVKESKGKEIEIKNNMTTMSNIHASRGLDFEETIEQRAKELKKIQDLEEEFGIEFPENKIKPTTTGPESVPRSVRAI